MSVLSDRGTDRTFDAPEGNPTAGVRPVVGPARLVRDLVAAFGRARREGRGAGLGADPGANGRGGPDATRRARATGGVDLRNTWQVVAGSVLVPLGVVLILVAWYGSAHTPYVQQQIPYLVSGSFAGLGCMVLGGLLYWAHWLYRIYDQADLHHEEQLHALRETLLAVAARIGASDVPPVLSTPGSGGSAADAAAHDEHRSAGRGAPDVAVRTAEGRFYHDPSCPIVRHHGAHVEPVRGATAGLEPCQICRPQPLVAPSP